MLYIMKLTDEAVDVVVVNYGQRLTIIDGFSQLNNKSVEGLCRLLRRPGGTTGGGVQSWGCSVSDGRGKPTRYDLLYQIFQKDRAHMRVCRC